MEQKLDKKCMFVLGMHRSGTSLVMGALNKMGVYLGNDLLKPTADNPKGYFENQNLVDIDEKILSCYNSSWDDLLILDNDFAKNEKFEQILIDIKQFIEKEFAGIPVFGLKDPRLCRLLPFWDSVLTKMKIQEYFIIPLRNPLEIAASLENRDGFSLEKSFILWMNHMFEAELYTRGKNRIFINYDYLLKQPETAVESIIKKLNIDYLTTYRQMKSELDDLFDPDLKHFNMPDIRGDKRLIELVHEFHISLLNLSHDDMSEKELIKINEQRERYYKQHRFFYNRDLVDLLNLLKETKIINHNLTVELWNTNSLLQEKEKIIDEIYNSRGWKLITKYREIKLKIFPKHG